MRLEEVDAFDMCEAGLLRDCHFWYSLAENLKFAQVKLF